MPAAQHDDARPEGPPRPAGRPMDAALSPVIIAAVLEELAQVGYARLTTASVARRAGVSTATLYRRWPSRRDLILAAAEHLAAEDADPDTGSLEGDLRALLANKQRVLAGKAGVVLASLAGEAAHDAELAAVVTEAVLDPTRRHLAAIAARAHERGSTPFDPEAATHLIIGTILTRAGLAAQRCEAAGQPLTAADVELLVTALAGPASRR